MTNHCWLQLQLGGYGQYSTVSDNNLIRSPDLDFQCSFHTSRFSLLRSRHKTGNRRRNNKRHKEHVEDTRLSRSLDDLPGDIREHILKCQCSCDHLGYGNYSVRTFPCTPLIKINRIIVMVHQSSLQIHELIVWSVK